MKSDIAVIRGTTNVFEITVTDASGNLYNLSDDEKLLFGVKRSADDEVYTLIKTGVKSAGGVYTITISPADTESLECAAYLYDVAIQSGNDFYNVIEASKFRLNRNVTKWGCGD